MQTVSCMRFKASACFRPARALSASPRSSVVRRVGPTPDAETMKKMMADPAYQQQMKAMQQAMQNPEVQKQVQEMAAFMQNQQLQQRLAALKDDPEFADMFAELKKGGMAALMKFWDDPKVLAKFNEKLADVIPQAAAGAGAGAGAPPQAPPAAPEIKTLLDAARYGDVEAVEDFIAIGKDVNAADPQGRTPLHFAAAYDNVEIAQMLIEAKANLEARDVKQNTPLHYAAGYGRADTCDLLLASGADKAAKNETGKTALELIKVEPRNPLNQEAELLKRL